MGHGNNEVDIKGEWCSVLEELRKWCYMGDSNGKQMWRENTWGEFGENKIRTFGRSKYRFLHRQKYVGD